MKERFTILEGDVGCEAFGDGYVEGLHEEVTQLRQQISHLKSQMEYLRQIINNALEEE